MKTYYMEMDGDYLDYFALWSGFEKNLIIYDENLCC